MCRRRRFYAASHTQKPHFDTTVTCQHAAVLPNRTPLRNMSDGEGFLRMTPAERDAVAKKWERGLSFKETRAMTKRSQSLWELAKRGRGRPRKPAKAHAPRVLICSTPSYLPSSRRSPRPEDSAAPSSSPSACSPLWPPTRRNKPHQSPAAWLAPSRRPRRRQPRTERNDLRRRVGENHGTTISRISVVTPFSLPSLTCPSLAISMFSFLRAAVMPPEPNGSGHGKSVKIRHGRAAVRDK